MNEENDNFLELEVKKIKNIFDGETSLRMGLYSYEFILPDEFKGGDEQKISKGEQFISLWKPLEELIEEYWELWDVIEDSEHPEKKRFLNIVAIYYSQKIREYIKENKENIQELLMLCFQSNISMFTKYILNYMDQQDIPSELIDIILNLDFQNFIEFYMSNKNPGLINNPNIQKKFIDSITHKFANYYDKSLSFENEKLIMNYIKNAEVIKIFEEFRNTCIETYIDEDGNTKKRLKENTSFSKDKIEKLIDFIKLLDTLTLGKDYFETLGKYVDLEEYGLAFDYINKSLLEGKDENLIDKEHYIRHMYTFARYYSRTQGVIYDIELYYDSSEERAMGVCNRTKKKIKLNKYYMWIISECFLDNLETIFHEVRHAKQHQELERLKINRQIINKELLLLSIDRLLSRNLKNYNLRDAWNSETNYFTVSYEADARYRANLELAEYISRISPTTYYGKTENGLQYSDYIFGSIQEGKDAFNANENYAEYQHLYLNRDMLLDKLMLEDPRLLKYYPILKYIYNENGIRKTIPELNAIKEDNKDNHEIVNMINFWIRTSKYSLKSLIRELFYTNEYVETEGYVEIIQNLRGSKFRETMFLESNYFLDKDFINRITEEIDELSKEYPDKQKEIEIFKKNILEAYLELEKSFDYKEVNEKIILDLVIKNIDNEDFISGIIVKCDYLAYRMIFDRISRDDLPDKDRLRILKCLAQNKENFETYVTIHTIEFIELCNSLNVNVKDWLTIDMINKIPEKLKLEVEEKHPGLL